MQADLTRREAAEIAEALEALHPDDLRVLLARFASTLAHELGTPLNVISGRAGLIQSGELAPDEVVASARSIAEQVARMTSQLHRAVDYARGEGPADAPIDLLGPASRAVELLRGVAERRSVSLVLEPIEPSEGTVEALARPTIVLGAIVLVLLGAIRAAPAGATIAIGLGTEIRVPPPREQGRIPRGRFAMVTIAEPRTAVDLDGAVAPWLARRGQPPSSKTPEEVASSLPVTVAYARLREARGFLDIERANAGSRWILCFPVPSR